MRWFVVLAALASSGCNTGDCSCALSGVSITSSSSDLVGASGCGHATNCGTQAPCDALFLSPPATGSTCTVGILFADGGTEVVTADFGELHHSTDCCGDFFDHGEIIVHVE